MLIIAIPKSSSTSFLAALSEVSNIPGTQNFKLKNSKETADLPFFKGISVGHSDMVNIDEATLNHWIESKECFYKQHILPTKHNIDILKKAKSKVIILIRNNHEILKSYDRVPKGGMKKAWKDRVVSKKETLKALRLFTVVYKHHFKKNKNFLFIDFYDVTKNTQKTLRKSLRFLCVKYYNIPNTYELPKKRFYRKNAQSRYRKR